MMKNEQLGVEKILMNLIDMEAFFVVSLLTCDMYNTFITCLEQKGFPPLQDVFLCLYFS